MTIKIRGGKKKAARSNSSRALLEHLKPEEAAEVLRRLLKARADLVSEAEGVAKAVLTQVNFEDIAAAVEDAVKVDIDDVYARAGKHEWGYVEPGEAALEILDSAVEPFIEDIKRQIDLGFDAEALETCKGVMLGLYRAAEETEDEVLLWAPEFPMEAAGHAIETWLGERNAGRKRLKRSSSGRRPIFPQAFVEEFLPQWSDMIARTLRASSSRPRRTSRCAPA